MVTAFYISRFYYVPFWTGLFLLRLLVRRCGFTHTRTFHIAWTALAVFASFHSSRTAAGLALRQVHATALHCATSRFLALTSHTFISHNSLLPRLPSAPAVVSFLALTTVAVRTRSLAFSFTRVTLRFLFSMYFSHAFHATAFLRRTLTSL